jgi:hypothetical protein
METKHYTLDDLDESQTLKDKKKKEKKVELKDLRWTEGIKTICKSTAGREVLWRILGQCKVFGSVWEPSAKIHYNAGKQDVGHWLMAEIVRSDENILFKMMTENKEGAYDE